MNIHLPLIWWICRKKFKGKNFRTRHSRCHDLYYKYSYGHMAVYGTVETFLKQTGTCKQIHKQTQITRIYHKIKLSDIFNGDPNRIQENVWKNLKNHIFCPKITFFVQKPHFFSKNHNFFPKFTILFPKITILKLKS